MLCMLKLQDYDCIMYSAACCNNHIHRGHDLLISVLPQIDSILQFAAQNTHSCEEWGGLESKHLLNCIVVAYGYY